MSSWNLAIIGAFAANLVALLAYFTASGAMLRDAQHRRITVGRGAARISFILLFAASIALLVAFLRHDFSLLYVASYSSRSMPTSYLVSGFWAGQEGTFLLWATMSALIGIILTGSTREHEPRVMPFFWLVQTVLIVLLLKASPFRLIFPAPTDGMGLNPLLQDPWMVIHPPIVFAGYALWAVPFAWAMSALAEDDYSKWVKPTLPWAVAAWLFLGAGIIIGAKWAYATLGWGGYWGWDPVENASLIPWLTGTALMHTLIMQRATGKMVRTNILLAIFTFLLVMYGTFLTRSGVLADFSVHSFASLGISAYLVWALIALSALSLGYFFYRWSSITRRRGNSEPYTTTASREFTFFLTALLIIASAIVTLLGTSSPLLTRVSGNPSAVNASFYRITNGPIGCLLAFVLGACPLLAWRKSDRSRFWRSLVGPAIAAAALTILAVLLGAKGFWFVIFLFSAFLALATNVAFILKNARGGFVALGGYIAHVGVALLLVGIIATSAYTQSVTVALSAGQPKTVFGWEFTYRDREVIPGSNGMALRTHFIIDVSRGNTTFEATPYMQDTHQGVLRHPSIHSTFAGDIYISPMEEHSAGMPQGEAGIHEITLGKGESGIADGLKLTFLRFDMSGHTESDQTMVVGAVLDVETAPIVGASPGAASASLGTVAPSLGFTAAGNAYNDAVVPVPGGSPVALRLTSIDATRGTATIRAIFMGQAEDGSIGSLPTRAITLEVSLKPFASLLWIGSIVLVLGTIIALIRRARAAHEPRNHVRAR
ncbi:MAG: cytochrome c biogenesis protein CcsA [Firmicutes bacterium]|nr:cytochrome c biogenesis protein CcsA [Bacillota bacterium]MDD4792340.1 cytochrome c biogenesis protein CcsA [Bacillota bacterium]